MARPKSKAVSRPQKQVRISPHLLDAMQAEGKPYGLSAQKTLTLVLAEMFGDSPVNMRTEINKALAARFTRIAEGGKQ